LAKDKKEDIAEENTENRETCEVHQTDTWRNRRRMAYFSLFSIILVTYWVLFSVPESRLKLLDEVITWFYFVMGSIIGAYMGFSAFEKKWNKSGGTK
jgi:hypothetical protein